MNTAKIVHVITRLDPGGSSENTLATCHRLNRQFYDVTLVYGHSTYSAQTQNFYTVRMPELVRDISLLKDLKAFLALYKLLKSLIPDIEHTHSSKAGIIGRWAARLAGVKTIIHTPHGHVFYGYGFSAFKTKFFIFLEKVSARITTRLIALTEGEKKESLARGIGVLTQWKIVHSGVDMKDSRRVFADRENIRKEYRAKLCIPENTIVAGAVARLEYVKGIDYLIEAAAKIFVNALKRPLPAPLLFLIVGDGADMAFLKEMAQQARIDKHIIFTGMRRDVFEHMAAMDIYVQPSLNEGMGKTIIQAQAIGLPVIASSVQGIPDALKENSTGLLVPPRDADTLALGIEKLIFDNMFRKEMGSAASAWVNETIDGFPRFSSERMIYLLETAYKEALDSR